MLHPIHRILEIAPARDPSVYEGLKRMELEAIGKMIVSECTTERELGIAHLGGEEQAQLVVRLDGLSLRSGGEFYVPLMIVRDRGDDLWQRLKR